ncbi:MAG: HAD hydrolase family protein [Desulfobulbaceae bacterium]|nr:HAD hydrolase family protein [Desulfobulbaceae bacterium]
MDDAVKINEQHPQTGLSQRNQALSLARPVRLLLLDVDGVLSDGRVSFGSDGLEIKSFHTQDGFGLRLLRESGIAAGIITGRSSEAVRRRAAELKLSHLYENAKDKLALFEDILSQEGLQAAQCAYMGDDWMDLPLLNRVGLAAAPANAVPEVRRRVHFVTQRKGGEGAVRELCDLLLEAQGLHAQLLTGFDR